MSLTLSESSVGGSHYLISYSAIISASSGGEATVPDMPYTISAWVLPTGETEWVHLRIVRSANFHVYVTVNNESSTDLGEYLYNGTLTNFKWTLNQLYGTSVYSAWADVTVWNGAHASDKFVYGSGRGCMPRDPLSMDIWVGNLKAWYDFADPNATGQIAKSGGWDTGDIVLNASSSDTTFLDATNIIPAGTVVTGASVYTAAGYGTDDSEICIYRKTGPFTGVPVNVKSLSISSSAGWHSVPFAQTVPNNQYGHYLGVYSARSVSMTTNAGQGMYRSGDHITQGTAFSMTGTFRSPITKWVGYKPAGLGQDVSGNGQHWDLTATQSTSTPTS
ncbi:hypothetical protein EDC59_11916 [Pseudodesulfovibrio indicus]|uniref:Uncharacterized protein n=2 Tax=Pseudodesulfovibrio indicus TaxID=1716143 RepID=A0A126QL01_9BACT|nr:hypothetical protein AWY79_04055 [Pseudodesulfovibrio indicus]TDT81965.1 hypothetical protein EDC59_11916 [Pseudodesulfovibrio indicus]